MRCNGRGDIWLLVDRILGIGVNYFLYLQNPVRLDCWLVCHSQRPQVSSQGLVGCLIWLSVNPPANPRFSLCGFGLTKDSPRRIVARARPENS